MRGDRLKKKKKRDSGNDGFGRHERAKTTPFGNVMHVFNQRVLAGLQVVGFLKAFFIFY